MTNELEKLQNWLNELGEKNQRSLELDGAGKCHLIANNGLELMIAGTPDTDYFTISAKLAPIPEENPLPLFQLALTLNLFQHEMDNASIAVHPDQQAILLYRTQKYRFTDYRKFASILDSMVEVGEKLKQQFSEQDPYAEHALPLDEEDALLSDKQ